MRKIKLFPAVLSGVRAGSFLSQVFFLFLAVFISTSQVVAQKAAEDVLVRGTITDKEGNPVNEVNVKVKGKKTGVASNQKGEFLLAAAPDAVLEITHTSFKKQEIAVRNRTQIDVQLESSVSNMDELVVVAYGKLKKSDLAGSISTVKVESAESRVVSVPEYLQGKVAGVQIITNTGEPGAGITFNIRGKTSVTGSNQPLIVIDGQPIESGLGATMAGIAVDGGLDIPPSDPLAGINVNDIASVEILKDASSIAIYGSRGANGVVLITTKSGRAGKDKITYSNRFDMSMLPKKLKVLSSVDYAHFRNEAYLNDGGDSASLGSAGGTYSLRELDSLVNAKNVDWQDEVYENALSQDHTISISGRDEKNRYLLSGNYSDQKSIIRRASFERYGLRFNFEREISPKLTVGIKNFISLSNRIYGQQSNWTGILGSSAVMGALSFNPLRTPYDPDGTIDEEFANNPVLVAELVKDKTEIRTIISNLNIEYKFNKHLTYLLKGGINHLYSLRNVFYPTGTFIGNSAPGGSATRADQTNTNALIDNILTYTNVFSKKHSVNLVGGFSYQAWKSGQTSVTAMNFPSNALQYYNFSTASSPGRFYNPEKTRALASVLTRLNYTYDKRYILTLTGRYDGATRLADGNKWRLFPSVGLGWNVSQENFFNKLSNTISLFKLRGSYGIAGNENIAIGATQANYGVNTVVIGGNIIPGYVVGDFANANLGWETTSQLNVGADFGFVRDRVTLTVDAYKKTTTDLLINLSLPGSTGYANYYTNIGKVENNGVDIELNVDIMRGSKLKWDAGANISFVDNKVLDLGGSDIIYGRGYFAGGAVLLSQPLQVAKVGHPISTFWGYKTNGIYQNQDEINKGPEALTAKPGDVKWVDVNGDGAITDADKTIIGNPSPDFTFGFNTGISYKGLSLRMTIFGSQGNDLLNLNRWIVGGGSTNGNYNLLQDYWDGRWHGEGTSNLYPRVTTNPVRLSQRFPDYMVEDASFIRLQSLTLGYNFKMSKSKINALKVFLSGTNLFTITNYTGYDPNVNSFGHNSINSGVDFGTLPQPRTFSGGVEITF